MIAKKFGDWKIVMNLCQHMPADIRASNTAMLAVMAGRAEAAAKKHINAQDLKWRALSPEYVAWKAQNNFDSRILIKSSDYKNAISHDSDGKKAVAGISKSEVNSTGESMALYAKVMEFGSIVRKVPARPLWGPVLEEVGQYCKENQLFATSALNYMRRRAGK